MPVGARIYAWFKQCRPRNDAVVYSFRFTTKDANSTRRWRPHSHTHTRRTTVKRAATTRRASGAAMRCFLLRRRRVRCVAILSRDLFLPATAAHTSRMGRCRASHMLSLLAYSNAKTFLTHFPALYRLCLCSRTQSTRCKTAGAGGSFYHHAFTFLSRMGFPSLLFKACATLFTMACSALPVLS